MYIRKTYDTWEIQGNYEYGDGYELVTTETSFKDARDMIKTYRENEPGVSFRIKYKREKKETAK